MRTLVRRVGRQHENVRHGHDWPCERGEQSVYVRVTQVVDENVLVEDQVADDEEQ